MAKPKRGKCRQAGCTNTFSEMIGGETAFGPKLVGECIPCHFAAELHQYKLTPDRVKEGPIGQPMADLLAKNGWSWEHLEASYNRNPPPEVR